MKLVGTNICFAVFPNFERHSDLVGVVLDSMSDAAWQPNMY